jgi:hypothetical protein
MKTVIFSFGILISAHAAEPAHDPALQSTRSPASETLVDIETPELLRNNSASYCLRNTVVMDTIVFHHTETPTTTTVQQINDMHRNQGWHMVGYHYVINAPYTSQRFFAPRIRVSQARTLGMTGAHAGSKVYSPVTPETYQLLADVNNITCGLAGGTFTNPGDMLNQDSEGLANYSTIGVAVTGNYAEYHRTNNPSGYARGKPRYPSDELIDVFARLACQIQRAHPRVNKLKWHSFYKPTTCPGLIQARLHRIRTAAGRYGCTFE